MSGLPLSFLFPSFFFPSYLTSPALFFFFVFHPPVNRFERWTLWCAKKDHQPSRERKEGPEKQTIRQSYKGIIILSILFGTFALLSHSHALRAIKQLKKEALQILCCLLTSSNLFSFG